MTHGRILSPSEQGELLEPDQLDKLEHSFRQWAARGGSSRRVSRARMLMIFLLIRYTGAKLSEVLSLDPGRDIHPDTGQITFHGSADGPEESRDVHISECLAKELAELLALGAQSGILESPFAIDPAFVRRKFYERAEDCGFNPRRAGPEMIRKARALELMRNNMPLPVVQRLLGHSTPNLTASHISFSEEDMRQVTQWYMERESGRKTSARNNFFGKVTAISRGGLQSLVELVTPGGDRISTMVTNSSVERLGLRPGRLASAEIKAPWLSLEHADRPGKSSADNIYRGVISALNKGTVNVECEVDIHDGMKLCAILSEPGFSGLGLAVGDPVNVLFSCYAVVLHAD